MEKKRQGHVYMRLDRMKKMSGEPEAKARSMGVLPKIALMYRSRRIVWGVVLICVVAWFAGSYLATPDVEPKCWFCSAGERAKVTGRRDEDWTASRTARRTATTTGWNTRTR